MSCLFEFERQNITGCFKQTFRFQFNIKLIQSKTWFFQFSQWPTEWAQKSKFLQNICRGKWFHETELRGLYLYHKKCFERLTLVFISIYWMGSFQNYTKIKIPWWLLEGRARWWRKLLPDWPNWLCYLAGSPQSHRGTLISFKVWNKPSIR